MLPGNQQPGNLASRVLFFLSDLGRSSRSDQAAAGDLAPKRPISRPKVEHSSDGNSSI